MNFSARAITKRSIKEVLKVIETYFLGPTDDLIFGSISPLVLGGVGIPRFPSRAPLARTLPSVRKPTDRFVRMYTPIFGGQNLRELPNHPLTKQARIASRQVLL